MNCRASGEPTGTIITVSHRLGHAHSAAQTAPTLAGIGATHSAMDIFHPISSLDTNIQAISTQPPRPFSSLPSAPLESLSANETSQAPVATHTNTLEQTVVPIEQPLHRNADSIPTGDGVPPTVCFYQISCSTFLLTCTIPLSSPPATFLFPSGACTAFQPPAPAKSTPEIPVNAQTTPATVRQPSQNGTSSPVGIPKHQQKYIENVLSRLLKTREAEPFRDPVDPIAHKVPDYLNVIKDPMDLGTIERRLRQRGIKPGPPYTRIEDFVRDVKLVFQNCYTYNGDTHPVSALASKVSDQFESAMTALPSVEVRGIRLTSPIKLLTFFSPASESWPSRLAPKLDICPSRHTTTHFIDCGSRPCSGVSRSRPTRLSGRTCPSATRQN
jgi:hypothetical protein